VATRIPAKAAPSPTPRLNASAARTQAKRPGGAKALRQDLIAAALVARERAHAPYSRFAVGAAVLDEQGRIHAGCNVENAAYPQGWCAETSALAAMVLAGGKRVHAVAVVADSPQPCTPCGGCRQRLREFAADDCNIHIGAPVPAPALPGKGKATKGQRAAPVRTAGPGADAIGVWRVTHTLGELLPASFGPDHLESV
jgi:cytidine deaminase